MSESAAEPYLHQRHELARGWRHPLKRSVTVHPVRSVDRAATRSLLVARGLPWASDWIRGIVHGPETVRTQRADLLVFLDPDGVLRRIAG